jgi:phage FluMu gp28-like protein
MPNRPPKKAKCIPADPDRMLLAFQEDWRADRSRIKLAEKSRQIGWTWTDALDSVEQAAAGPLDVWVSSRDALQAKLYLDDCRFWAGIYQKGAKALGLQDITDDSGRRQSAFVLQFPEAGTSIYSLSSNPDAQAGKRGSRRLDEFALNPEQKLLYDIAYPGITWGGQLAIFSTHRGSGTLFNKLIREIREAGNPKGISLHRVTLEDALNQGLLYKLQMRLPAGDPRQDMDEADYFNYIRASATDDEAFQQEYMCVPADDASAFIEYALIDACRYRAGEVWEWTMAAAEAARMAGAEIYYGLDIGRVSDLTSLLVLEKAGGRYLVRKRIDLKKVSFSEQEAILYPWMALARRGCIDATGLGMQFAERAAQRFGKSRAEGVTFTGPVKEDLAYPVRSAFEDRAIRIGFDDDELVGDIRKIRKETTAAGNVRFAADRGEGGHADRFWSLALAIHAAKDAGNPILPRAFQRLAGAFRGKSQTREVLA